MPHRGLRDTPRRFLRRTRQPSQLRHAGVLLKARGDGTAWQRRDRRPTTPRGHRWAEVLESARGTRTRPVAPRHTIPLAHHQRRLAHPAVGWSPLAAETPHGYRLPCPSRNARAADATSCTSSRRSLRVDQTTFPGLASALRSVDGRPRSMSRMSSVNCREVYGRTGAHDWVGSLH